MRAKPIDQDRVQPTRPVPAEPVAAVAMGGLVADWHRTIESRLSGAEQRPEDFDGEGFTRSLSRALGWTSLLLGYGLIAYLLLG